MRKSIPICVICFLLLILSLVACEKSEPIGAVPVTPEMLASLSQALEEQTATEEETVLQTPDESIFSEEGTSESCVNDAPLPTSTETVFSEESSAANSISESLMQSVSVVYWTESGTVYHFRDTCSTLKRSKKIFQGSIEEAILAQKERVCKTCS